MPVRAGRCARCAPLGRGHFRIRTRCAGSLPHPGAARGHFRIRVLRGVTSASGSPIRGAQVAPSGRAVRNWPRLARCAQLAPPGPLCGVTSASSAVRGHFRIRMLRGSLLHPGAARGHFCIRVLRGVTFASGSPIRGAQVAPSGSAVRNWPRLAVRCASGPAWPAVRGHFRIRMPCGVTSASGLPVCGAQLAPPGRAVRNWPRLAVRCASGPAWPCGAQLAPLDVRPVRAPGVRRGWVSAARALSPRRTEPAARAQCRRAPHRAAGRRGSHRRCALGRRDAARSG